MALGLTRFKTRKTSTGHTYRYYSSVQPSKTTILFIHGFPYSANVWHRHVAFFEQLGYGYVVPEILGHGGSDKPRTAQDYCMKTSAESLVDILAAEAVDTAVVVGHDWGSTIGTRLAVYHPQRVLALVLVSVSYWAPDFFDLAAINSQTEQAFGHAIFGYWGILMKEKNLLYEHQTSFLRLWLAKDPDLWKEYFATPDKLREWITSDRDCEVDDWVTPTEWDEFASNDWEAATQYYHCYAENHNWECESDLPEEKRIIKVPSLIVAATNDSCSPIPLVESTLRSFIDSKMVQLEGGHHMFLTCFKEFNKEVVRFLTDKNIKSF